MEKIDNSTLLFRTALKWLGVDHKLRLGFGVMLGFILEGVRGAAAAYWAGSQVAAAFAAFGFTASLALGVCLAFAPLFLLNVRIVGESDKATFDTVDEIIVRSGLSAAQRRLVYRALLEKVQHEFSPEKPLAIGRLVKKTVEEVGGEAE